MPLSVPRHPDKGRCRYPSRGTLTRVGDARPEPVLADGTALDDAASHGDEVSARHRSHVSHLVWYRDFTGLRDRVLPADVAESSREIRVSVPLDVKDGLCPAVGLSLEVVVTLDSPLAQRTVVDDRTGDPLPRLQQ